MSTGTKICEYVDEFALLIFFLGFLLEKKTKRKNKITFPTHPTLEFVLAPKFTLKYGSHQLSHDWHFQGNKRNKINDREFKISLHIIFDSS